MITSLFYRDQVPQRVLLGPRAQEALRKCVTTDGDIAITRRRIQDALAALDRAVAAAPEMRRFCQTDRALLVAQLTYLDVLERATTAGTKR